MFKDDVLVLTRSSYLAREWREAKIAPMLNHERHHVVVLKQTLLYSIYS